MEEEEENKRISPKDLQDSRWKFKRGINIGNYTEPSDIGKCVVKTEPKEIMTNAEDDSYHKSQQNFGTPVAEYFDNSAIKLTLLPENSEELELKIKMEFEEEKGTWNGVQKSNENTSVSGETAFNSDHYIEPFIKLEVDDNYQVSEADNLDFVNPKSEFCASSQNDENSSRKKLYTCTLCKKTFKKKWNLQDHRLYHSSTPHTCAVCMKECATKQALSAHLESHCRVRRYCCKWHSKRTLFICTHCNQPFKKKGHLVQHLLHLRLKSRSRRMKR